MKKKQLGLLFVPFIMLGCNNSNVNSTKSPFNDSYNPIGMKGQYNITGSIGTGDYDKLKKAIKPYTDNNDKYIISSYTRDEQTRDLKAAYFGKNLGAANLCSLTHKVDTNTRYKNLVTTKFQTTHRENQTVSGGINKMNPVVNQYIFADDEPNKHYIIRQQTWDDNEPKVVKDISSGTYDETLTDTFGLKAYSEDIYNHFNKDKEIVEARGKSISFSVLGDNNKSIYGMSGDKYLIKEATSIFVPYSTTVGDTYKAVNNFFYEALLEKVKISEDDYTFRFTNFRFYTELLILSEAISDEERVPVLYLEKPQLVEYSEIKYNINYVASVNDLKDFNKGDIPQPTER